MDSGSKPIEGVGTAVAAFVGFAEKGPFGKPTLVTNWSQFRATFGDFIKGGYLAHLRLRLLQQRRRQLPTSCRDWRRRPRRTKADGRALPSRAGSSMAGPRRDHALESGSAGQRGLRSKSPTPRGGQTSPSIQLTIAAVGERRQRCSPTSRCDVAAALRRDRRQRVTTSPSWSASSTPRPPARCSSAPHRPAPTASRARSAARHDGRAAAVPPGVHRRRRRTHRHRGPRGRRQRHHGLRART